MWMDGPGRYNCQTIVIYFACVENLQSPAYWYNSVMLVEYFHLYLLTRKQKLELKQKAESKKKVKLKKELKVKKEVKKSWK